VYTIGCLHHTGDLALAVKEVHRVLRPGGKAIVMLYNRHSFRQMVHVKWIHFRDWLKGRGKKGDLEAHVRAMYDSDASGTAAPYTDYVTREQVRDLFKAFSRLAIDVQNFDDYALAGGLIRIPRRWFLNNLARILGLDLYIVAVKAQEIP
jgi:SAM-dependent methyltransferase